MRESIKGIRIALTLWTGLAQGLWAADFPVLNETCHSARAKAAGNVLTISTGTIEAHAYNMSPSEERVVRRIIFEHLDYLVARWNEFQEKKNG